MESGILYGQFNTKTFEVYRKEIELLECKKIVHFIYSNLSDGIVFSFCRKKCSAIRDTISSGIVLYNRICIGFEIILRKKEPIVKLDAFDRQSLLRGVGDFIQRIFLF